MSNAADIKNAIVTGGSRGIGRAIAVELARAGYFVVINYLANQEAAEATLELVRQAGGDGEIAQFDVANEKEATVALRAILKRLQTVDVLVNNAGIAQDDLMAMLSGEAWRSVIETSLNGFFNVTKPVLRKMLRKKCGSVVTISSVSGLIANPGQANYSAAKAGLIGASRTLAAEVARLGIRVNVVAPGLIETDMIAGLELDDVIKAIPMGRVGQPEDVAKAVRFLASDDASYITGQVISVNGGMA